MDTRAAFLVALLAASTACASAPKPSVSQASFEESALVARVKTALLNDPVVGARRIDVIVQGDQVRLAGRVASTVERDRAVQIARGVQGVRSVTSELEIKP